MYRYITLIFLVHAAAVFQLTRNEYRSSENELFINVKVSKNIRIASPVVLLLTPHTIDEALAAGIPSLPNVPPDNNTRSPNRAQISEQKIHDDCIHTLNFLTAEDRRDFSTDVITVRFEADQTGPQVNEVTASVPIIDDDIDEAPEEVFMIDLTLLSSINTLTRINRRSSLCIINDNDGRYMHVYVIILRFHFDQSIF